MENNSITKVAGFIKKILLYQEPDRSDRFVLQENEFSAKSSRSGRSQPIAESLNQLYQLLRYAYRLEHHLEKVIEALRQDRRIETASQIMREYHSLRKQAKEIQPLQLAYYDNDTITQDHPVSASLEENSIILSRLYHFPQNSGVLMRRFTIPETPPIKAMLVYIVGLSDKKYIAAVVLKPLMAAAGQKRTFSNDAIDRILEEKIPYGQTKKTNNFREIQSNINSGSVVLFLDGYTEAILVDTTYWEHRTVDRPVFEQTVRGPQVAFGEVLDVNTSLIRSLCRSSDLISEKFKLGSRSQLSAVVMYIESIANPSLVAEVKRRIESIRTDFLVDSDVLLQLIGDHPNSPFPTTVSTERPDFVAASLSEGRVAILMEGSPFVHVAPITFFSLLHSPEDYSMKVPYASYIRILRWMGTAIALLLPAVFLSISTFHQEAIPTDLALVISVARDQVPFPTLIEILLLDIAFELLREAGLRIPGILGPTIGIVGGIILGQAIVAAKIVSPIVIIIVAMTGLASFVIPEYRLAAAIRLMRFLLVGLAAMLGLVGVAIGLLVLLLFLCNMKSFGVPYMAPLAPKTLPGLDVIVRGPLYRQEWRPDELQTQDGQRQPHISRGWIEDKPEGSDHP